MARIAAETLDELFFRQNDNPPTRAQKLEILKRLLQALRDEFDALEIPVPGQNIYRIPGYFTAAPAANATLHLHSVTTAAYIPANFEGSEAHVGISPAAEFEITIYRNPTFTGEEITGGEVIGTLTYGTDSSVTWASWNGEEVQLEDGDLIGMKAPGADASIRCGSFTIYAIVEYIANLLLLSGDMTDGDDLVLLSGDMQSDGSDALVLSGDEQYG